MQTHSTGCPKSRGKPAKPPIYTGTGVLYDNRGSFPISHPLGPLCLQGGSFFVKKRDGAPPSLLFQVSNFSESALSSRTAP